MIHRRAAVAAVASLLFTAASTAVAETAAAPRAQAATTPAATRLTAEQRAALRAELARYLRQDSDGLVSQVRAGGGISLALDGRYQHAIVARPAPEGGHELACFDDADAAVAFLALDDRHAAATSTDTTNSTPRAGERDR